MAPVAGCASRRRRSAQRGVVVVVDVAQHHALVAPVHDEAYVLARAHGPEVLVAGVVELAEAEARLLRIELQVEGGGLRRLLLVRVEAREAVSKGVNDEEVNGSWSVVGG